ncbi:MAG TPA: hypothetical protein ENN17_12455 [bacterium]|nr:hypothetical protein [bacterium]
MRRFQRFALIVFACMPPVAGESLFHEFITRSGDRLLEGDYEVRFISWNVPNLHLIEDHLTFGQVNPWRLPDEFEIRDAFEAVRRSGGRVVRIYTLSVRRDQDTPDMPRHVTGPGRFNEEAFQALDRVLQVANETGVRVIIPFVENWKWFGGVSEYAAFRGKPREAFWTDPEVIGDFKKTIAYLLNRRNVHTGLRYRDDRAVFAWETGNELQCPQSWTDSIAAFIKRLDPNHLVIDGFHTTRLRKESVESRYTDILTTHHYEKTPDGMIGHIRESATLARREKPYFIGEFGFIEPGGVRKVLDTVMDENIAGALIWSLRFRNRDGGFYWHSEPWGGDRYKAYLWPGFETGDAYEEIGLCRLLQEKAFAIRGMTVPPPLPAAAPALLPIPDQGHITWRGSAGAEACQVQRSQSREGPWETVGERVLETAVQYRPLFHDTDAETGGTYFYRVFAVNAAGLSQASNIEGPVTVENRFLIDEFQDFTHVAGKEGAPGLRTDATRQFREDAHRIYGSRGDALVYRVGGRIRSFRIYAFFPADAAGLDLSVSSGGGRIVPVDSEPVSYDSGGGDYDFWRPVLFHGSCGGEYSLFRIAWTTEAQIGRVEIAYTGDGP